ncbi:DUF305 domain-containing protein [Nocardioides sp.]|uniref:DUF305 domain-containing protein n=1 Tax=Nocardioides sp. TaxID=35761 RepID=UPI003D123395
MKPSIAAVLAVAVLVVAGCSSSDDTGSSSTQKHNDADVAFATEMTPHHAQALVMVDMTEGRDVDPAFADLTAAIKAAQAPEIDLMGGWLESWGEEVPEGTGLHHMDGASMGDMANAMSEEDFAQLDEVNDRGFEAMWLRMMIAHHEGAIDMGEAEVEDGRYPPALDLAEHIVSSQRAEIETMRAMLEQ